MTRIRRGPRFTARLVNSAGPGAQPHVLGDIRQAILDGHEPPGTTIPVDQVAHFFGVSQIPVREALKTLIGEGLVEHTPHIGFSVAKLTFEEFRELYDVRQALEASALPAAVRNATPADDDALRAVHAALAAAIGADDDRAYHSASRQFHIALLAPSRMQRLLHMYGAAWNLTEPARPMARVARSGWALLHEEHQHMVDAFVDRESDALILLSGQHYEHLREAIEGLRDDPDVFRQSPL
jgi:DNA-binding GntR family transcriptional regulator